MEEKSKTFYRDGIDCSKEETDRLDTFAATLGMGPKYKPVKTKKHVCPNCANANAYYKEIHPDTGMDEIGLYCPDCKSFN